MGEPVEALFREVAPAVEHCSLRLHVERDEWLSVRCDVPQPAGRRLSRGAMITVADRGGLGYAATSDLSRAGLAAAAAEAVEWARSTAGRLVPGLAEALDAVDGAPRGEHETPVERPPAELGVADRLDLLARESARLGGDERIVDREAGLWTTDSETLFLTAAGGRVWQRTHHVVPTLRATANVGTETITRTFGGGSHGGEGGLEVLDRVGFFEAAPRIAAEAVELVLAPNCPSERMDLLLAPDQLALQIHESIGHPLELDRILGDERNYAGRSFVTLDMLGSYRYGSELLNVVFDPTRAGAFASFAFDDEGQPAERQHLIRDGVLLRPIGGALSGRRAAVAPVAASRATSWNRPPIDRMANIDVEPGDEPFAALVGRTERGIYLETNASWSIDDSRNKFQFGCERGRLIRDGELGPVVKKPCYRGISATFWRNLIGVGDAATFEPYGTPYCGKGEPNQVIRVGHASPVCLFADVDVFGGVQ